MVDFKCPCRGTDWFDACGSGGSHHRLISYAPSRGEEEAFIEALKSWDCLIRTAERDYEGHGKSSLRLLTTFPSTLRI
jgi:hypothetical protein